jgi:hypothetical protein
MNESFTFWLPAVCALVESVFTAAALFLAFFVAFGRRDKVPPLLQETVDTLRAPLEPSACLREVQSDVRVLKTELVPLGESISEALVEIRGLRTDLQALADATRETNDIMRSTMDTQAPATPVPLEILTELRKTQGGPQIQRRLRAFSLHSFMEARAEGLARERMQANPSPNPQLD